MEEEVCAPNIEDINNSCIDLKTLIMMVKAYNKYVIENNMKEKIILLRQDLEIRDPTKYKKYIVDNFTERFGDKCTNQRCWTKQEFMKYLDKTITDVLENETFAPNGPQGKFEWLNSLHINDTLNQFMNIYPEFMFFGAVPLDFEKISDIGKIDFDELKKIGKTKIGMIINLDTHDKDGSHWVSLFADIEKGGVYFFDSVGKPPKKEIAFFMNKIAEYCEKSGIQNVRIEYNDEQNQYGNSECGVYSISFILRMLKFNSFEEIIKHPVSDDLVNVCRPFYFNDTNIKKIPAKYTKQQIIDSCGLTQTVKSLDLKRFVMEE